MFKYARDPTKKNPNPVVVGRNGLSFFEPEKGSFAVTKTLQIGVAGMAFVFFKFVIPSGFRALA